MVDIKFHCDEKSNFRKELSVRAFTYTDYSIQMHNHDFYELNIVLAGTGTHCIENGRFHVKCGDVFVIPPMIAHAYTDTENLEVYHILFKKSFFAQNQAESNKVNGFLQFTEIEPFLRSNFSNSYFLRLGQLELIQLRNDLEFIDDNSEFSWEECASMKYHAVWKLLYWFSQALYKQINMLSRSSENKYEVQVINALEYIHHNYSEKITINILCNEVDLSRSTFLRNFKTVCGVSPVEYLSNYRCKKAIEKLKFANCSKTEIAHSCGFYDLSHMERMLKIYR
ncbi:MAG: helix-turn-helix domain-containing protein [Ruminococcaceae bacterium]|nr:helix-turn-helix domain-containing protein [Oscillospiraceae bacterium]